MLVNYRDIEYIAPMLTKDVLKHYGSRARLAAAIGYTRQAIYRWGKLVPEAAAYRIAAATGGRFTVNPDLYRKKAA